MTSHTDSPDRLGKPIRAKVAQVIELLKPEFGDRLKQSVENKAGDFIYIEPGVPHEVFNMSDTEPVVAVVARSDADEWSHIVNYDRATGKTVE